jgi:hypothetical protein
LPGVDFGSSASSHLHADGDLDVGAVLRDRVFFLKKLTVLAHLARIGLGEVGLLFLDTHDIVLGKSGAG